MESFRNHDLKILCGTDVLARGIDIPQLNTVILFDVPQSKESYIHRTGRTNRRNKDGKIYILMSKSERKAYSSSEMF